MSFCKKFSGKVKSILKSIDEFVQAHADTALKVTTALEKFLAGPGGDILTAIIPTNIPAEIRSKLLIILPQCIDALTIVDACKTATTLSDKLNCFATNLKKLDPTLQKGILQKLAQLLTAGLHGNKLPQNLYDIATQGMYSVKYAKS